MVQQLAHLFRGAVRALVFGGNPSLTGLFDDFLANEMRALGELVDGLGPFGACGGLGAELFEQRFKRFHGVVMLSFQQWGLVRYVCAQSR